MTPWVNGGFTVEKVAGMLHHTKGIDFDQVAGMLRHTKGIDFKQVVQNLASSSTSASKAQYINLWTLKLYNGRQRGNEVAAKGEIVCSKQLLAPRLEDQRVSGRAATAKEEEEVRLLICLN
uniref:RxLR effector candidate protein n=1 Tax=Hyaloperonospora arabidopsidis (strain Emoy2) TaxID=559515 RepID=M4C2J3_HYAAE